MFSDRHPACHRFDRPTRLAMSLIVGRLAATLVLSLILISHIWNRFRNRFRKHRAHFSRVSMGVALGYSNSNDRISPAPPRFHVQATQIWLLLE